MSDRRTVLVTARAFDGAAVEHLEANGLTVVHPDLRDADPARDDLPGLLAGVSAWIVGGSDVDHALLAAHPGLLMICRRGVGHEQIDHDAARTLGRVVAICAGGNGPSVADHTIGLILAASKQMAEFTRRLRAGDWGYGIGTELFGKTVGIVGLGRVGRGVADRLSGFGGQVLATDITDIDQRGLIRPVRMVDLPTLLAESDVVTVHAPLTPATRHMFGAAAFHAMKRGALFINTARSGLVDEVALLAALEDGTLGGAGLDVFEAEKDPGHNAAAMALVAHPGVVATPHTAASTREGLLRTNMIAAANVIAVLNGGDPLPDCTVADGRPG